MIYRCPGCGSALVYSPEEEGMYCKYCDKIWATYQLDDEDTEDSMEIDSFEVNIYSCTACGAELMVSENEAATFCTHCGQPTVVFNRVSKEIKPDSCIPFSITKEEALTKIRKRLKKGWFVPKEVKNFEVDKLRGIYVPFWLHDVKIRERANISGLAGSGKYITVIHFFADAEGFFNNITTDASKRLVDEISMRLEPYSLNEKVPFDAELLSGFYADRFDVSEQEAREIAVERAIDYLEERLVKKISSCRNREIKEKQRMTEVTRHEYVLLPVWFMTFRYMDQLYTILVNGQTGKLVGNLPVNKKKVIALKVLLSILLTVIFTALAVWPGVGFLELVWGIPFCISVGRKKRRFKTQQQILKDSDTIAYVKERQEDKWTIQ